MLTSLFDAVAQTSKYNPFRPVNSDDMSYGGTHSKDPAESVSKLQLSSAKLSSIP